MSYGERGDAVGAGLVEDGGLGAAVRRGGGQGHAAVVLAVAAAAGGEAQVGGVRRGEGQERRGEGQAEEGQQQDGEELLHLLLIETPCGGRGKG